MTDPRIEAAARELKRLFSEGETTPDSMWLSCAKCVLEAADAAAWRPIESAPEEETIIVCGGSVSQPTTASWSGLPGNPWWSYSQENYSEGIDAPNHWQPLPSPPAVDVGGGNG